VQNAASLYRILQVDPAAEDVVIHAAYRALIKRHHPDHGGATEAAERLNAAYATLRDPGARERYDRSLPGEGETSPAPVSGGARQPLVRELGVSFPRRFEPVSAPGFAWMFDFVGAVAGASRERIWVARFHRGDPVDARTFRARIDAARLSRPLLSFTSSLFVAVLERASPFFTALVRGPRGPFTALTHAVAVLDLSSRALESAPGTARLPAFRALAAALAAAR
jgi:curved DNA-binding protein CbpA